MNISTRCTKGIGAKNHEEIRRFIVTPLYHTTSPRWDPSGSSFDGAPQLLPRPISAPASPANDYRPPFIFLFRLRMHSRFLPRADRSLATCNESSTRQAEVRDWGDPHPWRGYRGPYRGS